MALHPPHHGGHLQRHEAVVLHPAQVGLVENPQVREAVLPHGDALDAHAEGETLVLVGLDAAVRPHLGVHPSAASAPEPILSRAALPLPPHAATASNELRPRT